MARDFVAVAEAVRPVGLRGELKLYPLIDWHEALLAGGVLTWGDGSPCRAALSRWDGACPIVRVEGCDTREAAEARVGQRIGFARARYAEPGFPRPPEGLPFRYLGRQVRDASGEEVGRVAEVRRYGQLVLVVARPDGGEVLVPAVPPILRADEGLDGPLTIEPPPGLLNEADAVTDDRRD